MSFAEVAFLVGAGAGLALAALLLLSKHAPRLAIWPARVRGDWRGHLFWPLFRVTNLACLALAFAAWRAPGDLDLIRLLGALLAVASFSAYFLACSRLGVGNLYCGRSGLVTGGPYRWSRNPQYAAAIPGYLGLAVASGALPSLGLALVLALVFVTMARLEEPWLAAAYGEEYGRYCRRVPRLYNLRRVRAALRREAGRARRRLQL